MESEKVVETNFFTRNQVKFVLFYVLSVCSFGILYIVFEWFPHLYVKLYNPAGAEDPYTHLQIIKTDGHQDIVPVVRRASRVLPHLPSQQLTYLCFENQLFYFDAEANQFRHIETIMKRHLESNPGNFLESLNGLDDQTAAELLSFYGENIIEIRDKPYYTFLVEDIFSPLVLFQMLTCIVFSFIGYLVFGAIIALITLFTAMTMAYERLKANNKMRAIAEHEAPVRVIRNKDGALKECKMSSRNLVIGDIVKVQTGDLFTVDMIVVKGSCLVSEAVLTGEANPIRKTGVLKDDNSGNCHIAETNLLHCGSNCIMTKSESVEAVVIRTGWSTSKGELVSNIIYSKPVEFKFRNDVIKILLLLFCIGVFFVVVLLFVYVNSGTFLWSKFLDKSLEILTVALPPSLILSFTVGIKAANTNLKEKRILPVIIDKINEAGRVKFLCFDKTGTLTENSVRIGGFIIDDDLDKREIAFDTIELINSPNYRNLMEGMSCCHSLQMINDVVSGDPLDEELFFKTKFVLHEIEVNSDCKRYIKPTKEFRKVLNLEPDFRYEIVETNEFTPDRKRMSVIVADNYGKSLKAMVKGAPEQVKGICRPETIPGNFEHLLTEFSQKGYRIIALANKEFPEDTTVQVAARAAETNLDFVGFVLMHNPLKPETKGVIESLKAVDISCKMITGDNIYTSLNVACASGILELQENIFLGVFDPKKKAVRYLFFTAQELKEKITVSGLESSRVVQSTREVQDTISKRHINRRITCHSITEVLYKCKEMRNTRIAMDGTAYEIEVGSNPQFPEDLVDDFFEYAIIFSRASPKQKESIVDRLKNSPFCKKHIYCVGFVGDGSNDSKALRTANVGLSLGTNESSIASSFNTKIANIEPIVDVLVEGRANLELSIQNFKFIMITGVFQFFSITCLSFYNLDYNTGQYLMFDVCTIVPLALLMCRTKAADRLNKNIPRVSILNFQILSSIFGHLVLCLLYLVVMTLLIFFDPQAKKVWDVIGQTGHYLMDDYKFYQNILFTFFIDCVSIVICFAVNHSYPFRKSMFTNYAFFLYGFGWFAFQFAFIYSLSFELDLVTKFMHRFGLAYDAELGLAHQVALFTVGACLLSFLFEKTLNAFFLLKKRELNQFVQLERKGVRLSTGEKEKMTALFDLVSMN